MFNSLWECKRGVDLVPQPENGLPAVFQALPHAPELLQRVSRIQKRLWSQSQTRLNVRKEEINGELSLMVEPERYRHLLPSTTHAKIEASFPHVPAILVQVGDIVHDRIIRIRDNMSRLSTESDRIHLLLAVPYAIRQWAFATRQNPYIAAELLAFFREQVVPWQQMVKSTEKMVQELSDAFWNSQFWRTQQQVNLTRMSTQTITVTFSALELQQWQVLQTLSTQLREQRIQLACLLSLLGCLISEMSVKD